MLKCLCLKNLTFIKNYKMRSTKFDLQVDKIKLLETVNEDTLGFLKNTFKHICYSKSTYNDRRICI